MTSSQPVITPNALNFTPDNKHCYIYSGGHAANTTAVIALDFETQSEYIKGIFEIQIAVQNGAASNTVSMSNIKFNGLLIANMVGGYKGADGITWQPLNVIIPPFTEVTANLFSDENQADRKMTITFTGRTYGMTETGYQ